MSSWQTTTFDFLMRVLVFYPADSFLSGPSGRSRFPEKSLCTRPALEDPGEESILERGEHSRDTAPRFNYFKHQDRSGLENF